MSSTIHPEGAVNDEVKPPPSWPPTDLIPLSLGFISLSNPFRKWCINMATPNNLFDQFILVCIIANSVIMAMSDYSNIEGMKAADGGVVPNMDDRWEPSTDGSAMNTFVASMEIPFNLIFLLECLLKIIGLGFYGKKENESAYIRDAWNKLDFFVVGISLLGMLPGLPNLSVLRTFRVLRPLRTLARSPGLRKIIGAVIDSIPDLANVIVLLCFMLLIFSIAGLVFWNGILHARCRLTPFPVKMPAGCEDIRDECWSTYVDTVVTYYGTNYYASGASETYDGSADPYRCLNVDNVDPDPSGSDGWTVDNSPWKIPQDCIWPIDTDDERVCSLEETGMHTCKAFAPTFGYSTCGSNFDSTGLPRFISSKIPYQSIDRMVDGEFIGGLNYGYTSYDNIFRSFVTTFQACSMEGWTDIMYQTMDAWSVVPAVLIFVLLVLLGGNIVLNLVLAVVSSSLDKLDEDEDEEEEEEEEEGDEGKVEEVEVYTGLKAIVKNPRFGQIIMACILINTVVLACDHDGIEDNVDLVAILDMLNEILTFIFLGEMLLCIAALGPKEYFSEAFNCFDATIVVLSMFDFIYAKTLPAGEESGGGAVSALRGARLLRVLKMAKEWETMQTLLKLIAKTVLEIGNFGILLLLFIFIYSLCGIQFFSNRMVFDDMDAPVDIKDYDKWLEYYPDRPRSHFDSILWAMVTVFQILTGENWNACMYDGWRCSTVPELAVLYYLSLVIFGAFIVMNLFLAILLGNFEGNEDLMKDDTEPHWSAISAEVNVEQMAIAKTLGDRWKTKATLQTAARPSFANKDSQLKQEALAKAEKQAEEDANLAAEQEKSKLTAEATRKAIKEAEAKAEKLKEERESERQARIDSYTSLYIFAKSNPIRKICADISEHKLFDQLILVCILVSSFCLALDNPLSDQESGFNKALKALDLIFSIIFMIELVTKVIALGFVMHEGSYLRNPWNMLDAAIVLISILSLAEAVEGGSLKALRTFRVLRPLRMIKRFPELKLVVDALVSSVPDACNVIVISCLFLLLFAILGVGLFKGSFSSCMGDGYDGLDAPLQDFLNQYPDDAGNEYALNTYELFKTSTSGAYNDLFESAADPALCELVFNPKKGKMTSRSICECIFQDGGAGDAAWEPVTMQNFDNVGLAFNLLFEITTTEGWVDVMYAAVDQMGKDMQHKRDANLGNIAFFLLFMLIGAFFVMELFVGVVIDNFNRLREKKGGNIFMTDEQQQWAKTQAFIMKIKPEKKIKPPGGAFGDWCYNFVMPNINPKFDQGIMACIMINSLTMSMEHHGQSSTFKVFIEAANYVFAAVFTVEAILKLTGMRWGYFRDNWNKFDFIVVIGTDLGIVLTLAVGSGIGPVASIARMFRIGRLVRLINSAKSIRTLFNTLVTSIPSMANIGFLLMILFFIFSVMGVQSYAKISLNDDMTVHANFQSILESFLLLFRFATGENWNGFMHSLMDDPDGCVMDHAEMIYNASAPFCVSESDYPNCTPINGCGSGASISPRIYFYSFTLGVSFVMLNLFVGVVLDAFDNSEEGDILGPEDMDKFTTTWAEFDPEGTWHIQVNQLKQFVDDLDKPMGFGKEYHASDDELLNRMRETGMWDIPYTVENGKNYVEITHVASSLAKKLMKSEQGETFQELPAEHPLTLKMLSTVTDLNLTVGQLFMNEATSKLKTKKTLTALGIDPSPIAGAKKPDLPPIVQGKTEEEKEKNVEAPAPPPPAAEEEKKEEVKEGEDAARDE
ncbi:hypothetical protein TL16_g12770 [Triparma laevis f. inornata]|uniref:EF-hand domain-containing protein n=1 Tax=Triparma laevis f. inornata TaxID=1714386 RepID=A0A9W7EW48_9STRA|nr:hypothetical protein TL16_g12770 [Triparma laevis f. inornata]